MDFEHKTHQYDRWFLIYIWHIFMAIVQFYKKKKLIQFLKTTKKQYNVFFNKIHK